LTPLDLLNHLLNFLAPALGVAALVAALAKLLWRRALHSVSWLRLAIWGAAASAGALVAGLLLFGRDGRMATYAAMAVANALALWWQGFARARA
jgi:hypothetical protein